MELNLGFDDADFHKDVPEEQKPAVNHPYHPAQRPPQASQSSFSSSLHPPRLMPREREMDTTWRRDVLSALRQRNRNQAEPFAALVALQARTMERCAELVFRGGAEGATGDVSPSGIDSSELKRKVYELQDELTSLHRVHGENAQKVIDLSAKVRDGEEALDERTALLARSEEYVEALKADVDRLEQAYSNLEKTDQLLKDEYHALQLVLSTADKKLVAAQKENDQLVEQIKQFKEIDVARMNRENEEFQRRKQESVQRELEEAAKENRPVADPSLQMAGLTIGSDNLDSIICSSARIPTRAFLTFEAHDGEVNAIKWTPHGLLVATGGADRKVKLWDVSRGVQTIRGTLSGCNGAVMSVDFDSSGNFLLASSTDFACRVWSVGNQRLCNTFTGHGNKIYAARFMGESTRVCSGGHDRSIKVWDRHSKSCINTLHPGSSVNDLVCLSDYQIVSGHYDKKLRLYDVRAGTQPTGEVELGGRVTSVDLSRSGTQVLACTRADELCLVDLRNPTGCPVAVFRTDGFRAGCDYTRAVFSPDSEYVTVGSGNGEIFIWNVRTPTKLETTLKMRESVVVALSWQPAGNSLTSCDKNKNVTVWADI